MEILTIGHSTHTWTQFVTLLKRARVTAIADVRSAPYSRHFPQFNRDELRNELRRDGISYVFLGKELGGRPRDDSFYCDGVADYEKMARTADYKDGIDRVIEGAKKYRIALMCSERDPLDCHRCLLVSRTLIRRGVHVGHILQDGRSIDHAELEDELLQMSGREANDLFAPREERLASAYREQAKKVAFSKPTAASNAQSAAGDQP